MMMEYHDLAKIFAEGTSYCDWEGLVDPLQCKEHVRWIMEAAGGAPEVVKDLALHWVYTAMDQGDYVPSEEEVRCVVCAYMMVFIEPAAYRVRYWGKAAPHVDWETGEIAGEN